MSEKELNRVEVMARVKSRELKLTDAAALLAVCYRQGQRIHRAYRERGPAGLRHGNAGRPSHNAVPPEQRQETLRLVREHYGGEVGERFGPTLAAEHLEREHGHKVHAETLRRWMLDAGLWSRARKRQPYRKRREPKPHFGELVQMDGSHHRWLEERGARGCLMNMVDDATATAQMGFEDQETIWGAVRVLRRWIECYGVPLALYVDWKNIYVRSPNAQERSSGKEPATQFGRMCGQLGIRIIPASSPQAKGRVERAHGTHQDRLVKKLRVNHVATYAAANQFLEQEYVSQHNQKFARPAGQVEDYHRPAPSAAQLNRIFRLEQERSIGNDWVVRYRNRHFQLQRQREHYAPARAKVTVCEWADGTMAILYRGRKVKWQEIAARVRPESFSADAEPVRKAATQPKRNKTIPATDHPWRLPAIPREQRRAIRRWRDSSLAATPSSASP